MTARELEREYQGQIETIPSGGRWVASYRRGGGSCVAVLAGGATEQAALDALRRLLETWPRLRRDHV